MVNSKLVIIGAGETAEMAFEYFTHDSPYEVVAFSVEKQYASKQELCGLPVADFENIQERYPPATHDAFVAISYTQLNRVRARLFKATKEKGYSLASYISSKAFVWHNAEVGENCFIFENNVIQYKVKIGNNVVFWSGNHIGHQTIIRDNVFISSHVVVSGYCEVGENCFFGVNSCIANNIKIARDCVIGMGAVIHKDTEERKVYIGNPGKPIAKDSFTAFNVSAEIPASP
jgi:sugar O-acyltransferase (sialic acid O-acetyltransferase NeuD family)